MTLIEGKKIAASIELAIKQKIQQQNISPGLTVFLVGEDPASTTYVSMKRKACHRVGVRSCVRRFRSTFSQKDLLHEIALENNNKDTHAILVQMPLPPHICPLKIIESIDPQKDVDGFHPLNMGKTLLGQKEGIRPCTPAGICALLETLPISYQEKNALIVGRSNIVGKPLAAMLMQKTHFAPSSLKMVHSQTIDLRAHTKEADLLIVAAGKPHLIQGSMIKEGAVIIDVGISTCKKQNKFIGDVDFLEAKKKASFITPVPGGVGPMTVVMLLKNALSCFHQQNLHQV